MEEIQLLQALTVTLWEPGPSSPHLLVPARLAQLPHHRTVESLLQDGINSLFWMARHRLSLNGCALGEIHLSSVIGQICPVSLHQVFKRIFFKHCFKHWTTRGFLWGGNITYEDFFLHSFLISPKIESMFAMTGRAQDATLS